ncbi:MAG: asparaginase [Mobilicoccus sp.]|nr:asparaginase [Mobilicoccus sp.]
MPTPRVVVLGTGGTIAGSAQATDSHHYTAGVFSVDQLTAAVPGLADRVDLHVEQVFSLDSVDLTLDHRVQLARRITQLTGGSDAPDGVVVTHGTDTMEETAFVLHLLLRTDVPVVLTGAMRPADDPGADGPANLSDAATVAADPAARGLGPLVVFAGRVHGAREVSKRHASRLDSFDSDHGPLGDVVDGRLTVRLRPNRPTPSATDRPFAALLADTAPTLPRVEILHGDAETPPVIIRALADVTAGLVHAGPGAGNVPQALRPHLDEVRASGIPIVRAGRPGAGRAQRDGALSDTEHDWVAAGDLPPHKARVLLTLALACGTDDTSALQRLFDTL